MFNRFLFIGHVPLQLFHKSVTSCGIINPCLKASSRKFIVPLRVIINIGTVILASWSEMVQFSILIFFDKFLVCGSKCFLLLLGSPSPTPLLYPGTPDHNHNYFLCLLIMIMDYYI